MLKTSETIHGVQFEVKDGRSYRDGEPIYVDRTSVRWGSEIGDLVHVIFVSHEGQVKGFYRCDPYDSRSRRIAMEEEARRLAALAS